MEKSEKKMELDGVKVKSLIPYHLALEHFKHV